VEIVVRHLGDRVRNWITHNEPWCASLQGYQIGRHAPGHTDWPAALASQHPPALPRLGGADRAANCRGSEVGITSELTPAEPASPSRADRDACRQLTAISTAGS
jgi:beta-glucosidase